MDSTLLLEQLQENEKRNEALQSELASMRASLDHVPAIPGLGLVSDFGRSTGSNRGGVTADGWQDRECGEGGEFVN
jgi:hypothetical protein